MNTYDRFLSSYKMLLPILALLALTGCAAQTDFQEEDIRPLPFSIPYFVDNVKGTEGPLLHIDGIRQALIDSPDQPVRVLVLHGMITDEPQYSEDMQEGIGKRLGLKLAKRSPESIDINRGYDFTTYLGPQPFGTTANLSKLNKYVWVDEQQPEIPRLVYYEILWYPFRDQIKNFLLSCFESRSMNPADCLPYSDAKRNSDSRALLNGIIKDNVMVKGFGDPMILLGTVGDVIKDDIALTICIIAQDVINDTDEPLEKFANERCSLPSYEAGESEYLTAANSLSDVPFFAITYSLGSFLYMDTVQALEKELIGKNSRTNDALLLNIIEERTVYMMANQISLFQLARSVTPENCYSINGDTECPNMFLKNRDKPVDSITTRPTYIAFNDVNDLLGFDLPPYLQYTGDYGKVVNISVRNPGFSIPFLFKSPSAAHRNHAKNPAVIKAVVEGIQIPKKQIAD